MENKELEKIFKINSEDFKGFKKELIVTINNSNDFKDLIRLNDALNRTMLKNLRHLWNCY